MSEEFQGQASGVFSVCHLGVRSSCIVKFACLLHFFVAVDDIFTCVSVLCFVLQVSLTTFAVYTLSDSDNVLDAEKAFVSLSLFNIMRFPMSMLPNVITNIVQVGETYGFVCGGSIILGP